MYEYDEHDGVEQNDDELKSYDWNMWIPFGDKIVEDLIAKNCIHKYVLQNIKSFPCPLFIKIDKI